MGLRTQRGKGDSFRTDASRQRDTEQIKQDLKTKLGATQPGRLQKLAETTEPVGDLKAMGEILNPKQKRLEITAAKTRKATSKDAQKRTEPTLDSNQIRSQRAAIEKAYVDMARMDSHYNVYTGELNVGNRSRGAVAAGALIENALAKSMGTQTWTRIRNLDAGLARRADQVATELGIPAEGPDPVLLSMAAPLIRAVQRRESLAPEIRASLDASLAERIETKPMGRGLALKETLRRLGLNRDIAPRSFAALDRVSSRMPKELGKVLNQWSQAVTDKDPTKVNAADAALQTLVLSVPTDALPALTRTLERRGVIIRDRGHYQWREGPRAGFAPQALTALSTRHFRRETLGRRLEADSTYQQLRTEREVLLNGWAKDAPAGNSPVLRKVLAAARRGQFELIEWTLREQRKEPSPEQIHGEVATGGPLEGRTPRQVFMDYLQQRRAGTVEQNLGRHYSEDVVFASNHGDFVGHAGVKKASTVLREIVPTREFDMDRLHFAGNQVFETWSTTVGGRMVTGFNAFHIEGGKIVSQTSFSSDGSRSGVSSIGATAFSPGKNAPLDGGAKQLKLGSAQELWRHHGARWKESPELAASELSSACQITLPLARQLLTEAFADKTLTPTKFGNLVRRYASRPVKSAEAITRAEQVESMEPSSTHAVENMVVVGEGPTGLLTAILTRVQNPGVRVVMVDRRGTEGQMEYTRMVQLGGRPQFLNRLKRAGVFDKMLAQGDMGMYPGANAPVEGAKVHMDAKDMVAASSPANISIKKLETALRARAEELGITMLNGYDVKLQDSNHKNYAGETMKSVVLSRIGPDKSLGEPVPIGTPDLIVAADGVRSKTMDQIEIPLSVSEPVGRWFAGTIGNYRSESSFKKELIENDRGNPMKSYGIGNRADQQYWLLLETEIGREFSSPAAAKDYYIAQAAKLTGHSQEYLRENLIWGGDAPFDLVATQRAKTARSNVVGAGDANGTNSFESASGAMLGGHDASLIAEYVSRRNQASAHAKNSAGNAQRLKLVDTFLSSQLLKHRMAWHEANSPEVAAQMADFVRSLESQ